MRTSRIFLAQPLHPEDSNKIVEITGDRAHYLSRVLRLNVGDSLVVFSGEGGEFAGQIVDLSKSRVSVQLGDFQPLERALDLPVTIGLCITKRDAMDIAVQKVTELGVANIQPLISNRVSVAQKQIRSRQSHWRNITISACEQCGLNRLPRLYEPASLATWCSSRQGARFVADQSGPAFTLQASEPLKEISLLVGPEGGFSSDELELIHDESFSAVNLGTRILRAETAAVSMMTLANQALTVSDHSNR